MYLAGRGHQHTGPGTSMTQFNVPAFNYRGMGACGSCETKSYLGACCADCAKGSNCSGSCKGGLMGLGIFESGLDLSQWGWPEIGISLLALWGLSNVFSTGKRGVRAVKKFRRRRKAAVAA